MKYYFILAAGLYLFSGCSSRHDPLPGDFRLTPSVVSQQIMGTPVAAIPKHVLKDTCKPALQKEVAADDGKTKADFFIHMPVYNTEQGLALSTVSSGIKDKRGNLWFGTNGGGISRYDGKAFVNYTTEQGLGNNGVNCMLQDESGNLWFGTSGGGVSRFDGRVFKNYSTSERLAGANVASLILDKKGLLWVATTRGLSRVDPRDATMKFSNFSFGAAPSANRLNSIVQDPGGLFWLGNLGNGVYVFDGEKVIRNYTTSDGLSGNFANTVLIDKSGNVWIGTETGISCIDAVSKKISSYYSVDDIQLEGIRCCLEDRSGLLWFGCKNGLVCYDPIQGFSRFTVRQGLPLDDIRSITEDNDGNLWLGTFGGGLGLFEGKAILNYTAKQGLCSDFVITMCEDHSGDLWLGTVTCGIVKFSCSNPFASGSTFTDFNNCIGLHGAYTLCMIPSRSGDILVGTASRGLCRFSPSDPGRTRFRYSYLTTEQGLPDNNIYGILEDRKGNTWFATNRGVSCFDSSGSITNYSSEGGLTSNSVRCLAQGRNGDIWFGTQGGGVSIFDGKTFRNFSSGNGFPCNNVWCVSEDTHSNIWLGTELGLVRCDARSISGNGPLSVTTFATPQGLPNNFVSNVTEDADGHIWVGTNSGIAELRFVLLQGKAGDARSGGKPEQISGSNSLSNDELTEYRPVFDIYNQHTGYAIKDINTGQGNLLPDAKGILWAATGDVKTGLVRFDRNALHKNSLAPSLVLQSIQIDQRKVDWENRDSTVKKFRGIRYDSIYRFYPIPNHLVLPFDCNNISFDFAAIEPAKPNLIKYQYLLEGYGKDWSPVLQTATATFGNIHEGNYTFKVRAQSPEGIWCEPVCYSFRVLPPWYRTWWSLLADGLAVFLLLRYLIRRRTISLRNEKLVLEQAVTERTMEVVKQKQLVDAKNLQITDSINYARFIQDSLLLSEEDIKTVFPFDAFVFFQPKDIVSGDFYWFSSVGTRDSPLHVVAAVDCTGHGVPGAFMSMIGNMLLNKIVNEKQITDPSLILKEIQNGISDSLHRKTVSGVSQDGMDISVCVIDPLKMCIHFSGAMHPVYIVKKKPGTDEKTIETIHATTFSIGDRIWIWNNNIPKEVEFASHTIPYQKGTMIYLFSDGYRDQVRGADKERFGSTRFKKLLFGLSDLPVQQQRENLEKEFEAWKGGAGQVDDILVIGACL